MISIPIVSEFDGKGISKAVQEFKQLETAGQKAQFAIKKAAVPAAAALGALTVVMGDAVKAAIEDEKSQKLLARQLQVTTGATDAQIKAVEEYITVQGKNLGITDDKLRPALAGLVRATKDVSEAQNAANLAIDIAAAKGIDLETVTKALEKAYGGNYAALAKLDPSVRDMIKGGASLEEVFAKLSTTFGGAASDAANTAAGRFARLKLSLDETKESIGAALLPVVEKALPKLQAFAAWAQGNPQVFTNIAAAIGAVAASTVAVNAAMKTNPYVLAAAGVVALAVGFERLFAQLDKLNKLGGLAARVAGILIGGPIAQAGALFGFGGNDNKSSSTPAGGGFRAAESATSGGIGASMPALGAGVVAAQTPKKIKKATRAAAAVASQISNVNGFAGFSLGEVPISLTQDQIDPSIRQSGDTNVNINVNGGDPQAVVDALRQYMRQNGSVPIRTAAIG